MCPTTAQQKLSERADTLGRFVGKEASPAWQVKLGRRLALSCRLAPAPSVRPMAETSGFTHKKTRPAGTGRVLNYRAMLLDEHNVAGVPDGKKSGTHGEGTSSEAGREPKQGVRINRRQRAQGLAEGGMGRRLVAGRETQRNILAGAYRWRISPPPRLSQRPPRDQERAVEVQAVRPTRLRGPHAQPLTVDYHGYKMSTMSNDTQDWQVTLKFTVPAGDEDADLASVLLDQAVAIAPACAAGFVGGANSEQGTAEVEFTIVDASSEFANEVANRMQDDLNRVVTSASAPSVVLS